MTRLWPEAAFPSRVHYRLYERAVHEQWEIDRDIVWNDLDLGLLGAPARRAMAALYTQIQFGEVVAHAVAARMTKQAPDAWLEAFAEAQLEDEARHAEFFARVLARLGGPEPVLTELESFAHDLCESSSYEELLLGTQVVLEGFAQAIFQEGARLSRRLQSARIALPGSRAAATLLQHIDQLVGRDESRHVAFGVVVLRDRVHALDRRARDRLEERGLLWTQELSTFVDRLSGPLSVLGVSSEELKGRVRSAQRRHFRDIGLAGAATQCGSVT